MVYRRPKTVSRNLNVDKQQAFIDKYNTLLNGLANDEAVLFADAVHPTHGVHPVGCWAPKDVPLVIEQSSGRDRDMLFFSFSVRRSKNQRPLFGRTEYIHGAIDLETGTVCLVEAERVNAISTIELLSQIESTYPRRRRIHVFVDQAGYHHARLVQEWLARPNCRIVVHFLPAYCPHLNPIERLWGVMHRHVTHNKTYLRCKDFKAAILRTPQKLSDFWDKRSEKPRESGFNRSGSHVNGVYVVFYGMKSRKTGHATLIR